MRAHFPTGRTHQTGENIVFNPYRLSEDGELQCPDGSRVQLPPRLSCILSELAANKGKAVSRLDLLERCWPGEAIGEESLTRAIADLRKIFRVHGGDCIETVYGLGYRWSVEQSDYDFREKAAFCQEAWQRMYQRQRGSLNSAEQLFAQALAKDRNHLAAWLGLAETQIHRMQLGYSTAMKCGPKAMAALDRALHLEITCADALAMKGLLQTWVEWRFAEARETLATARRLDSQGYMPNQAMAWFELAIGEFESAGRYFEAATHARPLSMTARAGSAFSCMYLGNNETALEIAREMVQVDAHGAVSLGLAAIFEAALGSSANAVAMAEKSFELLPESPVPGAILAYALARAGFFEKARVRLESQTKNGTLVASNTFACLAWLEMAETESALAVLESGFANRCPWFLLVLNDPRVQSLDLSLLKAALNR